MSTKDAFFKSNKWMIDMLQSRRAATDNHPHNPAPSDRFYKAVIEQAQAVNARRLLQQQHENKRQTFKQSQSLNNSELWWDNIFAPELHKAQAALQGKATLYESKSVRRNNRPEDQLTHVINLRTNRNSNDYLVAVENGTISFKKLQGANAVAIDGFYTNVELAKSSPCHARLMLAHMIKDTLEHAFMNEGGFARVVSTRGLRA